MTVDYDAALRAAQVGVLDVLLQSWDGPFPAPAITPVVNDLVALARVVGAVEALAAGVADKFPDEGQWTCLVDDWSCKRLQALEAARA